MTKYINKTISLYESRLQTTVCRKASDGVFRTFINPGIQKGTKLIYGRDLNLAHAFFIP